MSDTTDISTFIKDVKIDMNFKPNDILDILYILIDDLKDEEPFWSSLTLTLARKDDILSCEVNINWTDLEKVAEILCPDGEQPSSDD